MIVARQPDGTLAAFHNVCQHRGSALNRRRHGWVRPPVHVPVARVGVRQRGVVVGVPEREDFDPAHLDGLRAPAVAADEWAGWIWINLAGPDEAPALVDWIGPDILADLGRFRMEDMVLHEKLVYDVPVNYKAIVDGFNEVYHVTELHHVDPIFTKSARGHGVPPHRSATR